MTSKQGTRGTRPGYLIENASLCSLARSQCGTLMSQRACQAVMYSRGRRRRQTNAVMISCASRMAALTLSGDGVKFFDRRREPTSLRSQPVQPGVPGVPGVPGQPVRSGLGSLAAIPDDKSTACCTQDPRGVPVPQYSTMVSVPIQYYGIRVCTVLWYPCLYSTMVPVLVSVLQIAMFYYAERRRSCPYHIPGRLLYGTHLRTATNQPRTSHELATSQPRASQEPATNQPRIIHGSTQTTSASNLFHHPPSTIHLNLQISRLLRAHTMSLTGQPWPARRRRGRHDIALFLQTGLLWVYCYRHYFKINHLSWRLCMLPRGFPVITVKTAEDSVSVSSHRQMRIFEAESIFRRLFANINESDDTPPNTQNRGVCRFHAEPKKSTRASVAAKVIQHGAKNGPAASENDSSTKLQNPRTPSGLSLLSSVSTAFSISVRNLVFPNSSLRCATAKTAVSAVDSSFQKCPVRCSDLRVSMWVVFFPRISGVPFLHSSRGDTDRTIV
ncbi:hypothetical protein E2P81_ATG06603 [Venturia nashicola]|nr:hypothetical protein E2P81_ATG06603 [Venturia nashicola]